MFFHTARYYGIAFAMVNSELNL